MSAKPKKKPQELLSKSKKHKPAEKKKNFSGFTKWLPFIIITFAALIYIRALYNGFASLDDDDYIKENLFIKDFSIHGIKAIFSSFYLGNYHPLTTLTYLFEHHFYGMNAFPYHLFNVLLHLLNIWLVYKLVEKISGKSITAFVVSVLFAIHPMHVESVAWVSERKDVLYTLFYLLSLLLYLRYQKSGFNTKYYIACIVMYILSLLSKSAAVTLPVLMIAIDLYKGRKINLKLLLEKAPFLLLSILFGILALMSQQAAIKDLSIAYSFIDRIFIFSYTISFYIVMLVAPMKMSAMHFYPNFYDGFLPWQYYASLPFLILIIITAILILLRSSFRKELLFGIFFFLITISIMLQIVSVGNAITAERYAYVSYIGLFYIIGQWMSGINKIQLRNIIVALFVIFALVMSFITWDRIKVWKNGYSLFSDVINKYPDNHLGYWMRGNCKNQEEEYEAALSDYSKTLELNPNFSSCLVNRGHILNKLNNYKDALKDLVLAIKLDSTVAEAYNNRGMAYDGLRDTASAMRDYNKAIILKPKLQKAYNNRGVLKANEGNLAGALKDANTAITLDPEDAEAYSNRANIKAMSKDFKGSIEDYGLSLKFKPNENSVYYNRGVSRLLMKDTTGACEDWKKASEMGSTSAAETVKQFCH
jgi:protein O-mannosyl-transferase